MYTVVTCNLHTFGRKNRLSRLNYEISLFVGGGGFKKMFFTVGSFLWKRSRNLMLDYKHVVSSASFFAILCVAVL